MTEQRPSADPLPPSLARWVQLYRRWQRAWEGALRVSMRERSTTLLGVLAAPSLLAGFLRLSGAAGVGGASAELLDHYLGPREAARKAAEWSDRARQETREAGRSLAGMDGSRRAVLQARAEVRRRHPRLLPAIEKLLEESDKERQAAREWVRVAAGAAARAGTASRGAGAATLKLGAVVHLADAQRACKEAEQAHHRTAEIASRSAMRVEVVGSLARGQSPGRIAIALERRALAMAERSDRSAAIAGELAGATRRGLEDADSVEDATSALLTQALESAAYVSEARRMAGELRGLAGAPEAPSGAVAAPPEDTGKAGKHRRGGHRRHGRAPRGRGLAGALAAVALAEQGEAQEDAPGEEGAGERSAAPGSEQAGAEAGRREPDAEGPRPDEAYPAKDAGAPGPTDVGLPMAATAAGAVKDGSPAGAGAVAAHARDEGGDVLAALQAAAEAPADDAEDDEGDDSAEEPAQQEARLEDAGRALGELEKRVKAASARAQQVDRQAEERLAALERRTETVDNAEQAAAAGVKNTTGFGLLGLCAWLIGRAAARRGLTRDEARLRALPFRLDGYTEALSTPPRSLGTLVVRVTLADPAPPGLPGRLPGLEPRARAVEEHGALVITRPGIQGPLAQTNYTAYAWLRRLCEEVLLPLHRQGPIQRVEISAQPPAAWLLALFPAQDDASSDSGRSPESSASGG